LPLLELSFFNTARSPRQPRLRLWLSLDPYLAVAGPMPGCRWPYIWLSLDPLPGFLCLKPTKHPETSKRYASYSPKQVFQTYQTPWNKQKVCKPGLKASP